MSTARTDDGGHHGRRRIHRSTAEKYSARFFNYLIWWVWVLVVVRVLVRVTVGARVMVGVGLVRG